MNSGEIVEGPILGTSCYLIQEATAVMICENVALIQPRT